MSASSSRSSDPGWDFQPVTGPAAGFLVAFHRKMEQVHTHSIDQARPRRTLGSKQADAYFLAHCRARPVLFGLPLILPADSESGWTGAGLYSAVWMQVGDPSDLGRRGR